MYFLFFDEKMQIEEEISPQYLVNAIKMPTCYSCNVLPSPAEKMIFLARPKFIRLSQNDSNELIVIWYKNSHNIELNITHFVVYEQAFYEL